MPEPVIPRTRLRNTSIQSDATAAPSMAMPSPSPGPMTSFSSMRTDWPATTIPEPFACTRLPVIERAELDRIWPCASTAVGLPLRTRLCSITVVA